MILLLIVYTHAYCNMLTCGLKEVFQHLERYDKELSRITKARIFHRNGRRQSSEAERR